MGKENVPAWLGSGHHTKAWPVTLTDIVNRACSLLVALMLFAVGLLVKTCQAMGLVVVEKKPRPLGDSLPEVAGAPAGWKDFLVDLIQRC